MPNILIPGLNDEQIDRMRWFIQSFYPQIKDFIKNVGLAMKTYYRMLDGDNVGIGTINKLAKGGMSPGWLISGEGMMFANNHIGKELLYKYKNLLYVANKLNSKTSPHKLAEAIEMFIGNKFGSIEKFAQSSRYNLYDLNYKIMSQTGLDEVIIDLKSEYGLTEEYLEKFLLENNQEVKIRDTEIINKLKVNLTDSLELLKGL